MTGFGCRYDDGSYDFSVKSVANGLVSPKHHNIMKKEARQIWNKATILAQATKGDPNAYTQLVAKFATDELVLAMWALVQSGSEAIPALIAGLKHPHTTVRRNCVDAIDHGGFGSDARCQEALLPLLHDPVAHIRRAAWHTLFCERCPDPAKCDMNTPTELDQVALLIEIGLNDPNPRLRRQLAEDLSNFTADPRARLALARIAQTETDIALVDIVRRALGS